jgi:hypothetical protein
MSFMPLKFIKKIQKFYQRIFLRTFFKNIAQYLIVNKSRKYFDFILAIFFKIYFKGIDYCFY